MPVGQLLGNADRFAQRFGDDAVTQAQLRQQGLGEGPDIGHQAVAVEALQRVGGPAFVAEFAVVVVLDDDRAQLRGAREQGLPARRAHRHAQRKLV
ncbi:hypothetical protein D3C79_777560 [compost metagenome]